MRDPSHSQTPVGLLAWDRRDSLAVDCLAEKVQLVKTALPDTARTFAGDACGMKETKEVFINVRVCGAVIVTSGVVRVGEGVKSNATAENPLSLSMMKHVSSSSSAFDSD